MKYTAWGVIAMGIAIFAFWGILSLMKQTEQGQANGNTTFLGDVGPLPLLIVSALAILGGALLLVFGGRGYFRTNNPAIHSEQ